MPVELRKRKAVAPPPEPPAKKPTSAKAKVAKAAAKVKEVVKATSKKAAAKKEAEDTVAEKEAAPIEEEKEEEVVAAPAAVVAPKAKANGTAVVKASGGKPSVGDVIDLEGFGGEVDLHDGTKTTLKALVDESKAGVVLFTYPRAMTGGCKFPRALTSIYMYAMNPAANSLTGTKQACLFRDKYTPLTAGGLTIYGLSTDSPASNTKFKAKENLQYPLLCDKPQTLLKAIGLAKGASSQRGVFAVDKSGKVLLASAGSPAGTVEMVQELVEGLAGDGVEKKEEETEPVSGDKEAEKTA